MGTKDVSPPTSPRRLRLSLEDSTSSAPLELIRRWLQVSGEVSRRRKSDSDSHTSWAFQHPAAASGTWEELLQAAGGEEKSEENIQVLRKIIILLLFLGGNAGNDAQNLSFWTVFNVLAPIKKLQARFWKEVGVAMRGRPAWRWRVAAF